MGSIGTPTLVDKIFKVCLKGKVLKAFLFSSLLFDFSKF